ncbi:MAG TPA: MAPEG family protein [Candidatus Dormibacteraeota bacterium]|nr:MAPEG family protein [Candidatus Dormibacteraeota bacterium]
MPFVHLVIGLALVQFILFGLAVARARERYNVPAPAMSGHEVFERYFRVQMNTLEQLVIFLPAVLLFSRYVNAYVAAGLGVVFLIGRFVYFRGYVRAARERHTGFVITAVANVILLVGSLAGAINAAIHW